MFDIYITARQLLMEYRNSNLWFYVFHLRNGYENLISLIHPCHTISENNVSLRNNYYSSCSQSCNKSCRTLNALIFFILCVLVDDQAWFTEKSPVFSLLHLYRIDRSAYGRKGVLPRRLLVRHERQRHPTLS